MDSIIEDVLPRVIPHPTQVVTKYIEPMPANNFQAMTCVPDVSLLDPDEYIPTGKDEKISFKLWKKHKIPPKATLVQQSNLPDPPPKHLDLRTFPADPVPLTIPPPSSTCCEERIQQLTTVIEQQQVDMNVLRNDYSAMKRDFDELKNNFLALSQKMEELSVQKKEDENRFEPPRIEDPFIMRDQPVHSGRWSLPGDYSVECMDMGGVLVDSNAGRAPPDKSQMLNNLFKKYFPKGENISPDTPILEYQEEEKSMATVNYMTKYKLLNGSERVLDISKLKRQSKLF